EHVVIANRLVVPVHAGVVGLRGSGHDRVAHVGAVELGWECAGHIAVHGSTRAVPVRKSKVRQVMESGSSPRPSSSEPAVDRVATVPMSRPPSALRKNERPFESVLSPLAARTDDMERGRK